MPLVNLAQRDQLKIDSLLHVTETKKDTSKYSALKKLAEIYLEVSLDTSEMYSNTLLSESKSSENLSSQSDAYNLLAYAKRDRELFEEAIPLFQLAYEIRMNLKEYDRASISLNLLGTTYHKKGELEKSLEHYLKAVETAEINNKPRYLSNPTSNIGKLYSDMGDYEKAKKYDVMALDYAKKQNDKTEMATSYNNLGTIFQETGHLDTAKLFYKEALKLYDEIGKKSGAAHVYNNMAIINFMEGHYDESLKFFRESMLMRLLDGDMVNYSQSLMNMGIYYQMLGDYDSAIYYADTSALVAKKYTALIEQRDALLVLAESYESINNYKEALGSFQEYILLKDSVMDEISMKNMQEMATKYKSEQQEKELELKDVKIQQEEEEKEYAESRKKFQFMIIGIAGLGMLLVLILIGRGYVLKRKSNIKLAEFNTELESQKAIIEEKNKDITDSILYAQRIQEAMLQSNTEVKSVFPDSFILYKPKDIVAGDFYWWENVGSKYYLAAADCTGHGVPGAMVSVVCANVLNKSVKELGLSKPSDILDKSTDLVIEAFAFHNNDQEGIKDGMDIALCSFDIIDKDKVQVEFSGANNPLWIIKKNGEFEEIKANRQPIGYYQHRQGFDNSLVTLEKGDTIYMFSDGYVDQFGGSKNKKFKTANFKNKLLSIQDKNLPEQLEILDAEFEKWKGDFEQTDDVCVIGVRI